MDNMRRALIISSRDKGSIGKGDQIVLSQLQKIFKEIDYRIDYLFIDSSFLLNKNRKADIVINLSISTTIFGFFLVLFKKWPLQTALYSNPIVEKKVNKKITNKYELVILSQERTFGLNLEHQKIIYCFIDALGFNLKTRNYSSQVMRYIMSKESSRLYDFTTRIKKKYIKLFISDAEANHYSLSNSISVPNYLDAIGNFKRYFSKEKKYDLVMSGNFRYQPNNEAAQWLLDKWPQINDSFFKGGGTLLFAGIGSEKYEYSRKNIMSTGAVQDILYYIALAKLSIVPMISGSGIQNKILESISVGVPCLVSSRAYKPVVEMYGTLHSVVEFSCLNSLLQIKRKVKEIIKHGVSKDDIRLIDFDTQKEKILKKVRNI